MGIFGNPNPFEEALDKVTNELNTEIDWGAIISLCDKVKTTSKGPQDFTVVVLQKINHKVPHVSMQAITVLDACVNNCGKDFHKAIASQHFTESLAEIINNSSKNKKVVRRLCYFIRKWAEDFKDDPELSHFVSFYYLHRGRGIQFPDTDEDASSTSKRSTEPLSKDPNVVSSQQEEEDIAKAIEASLKEEQQKKSISNSLSGSSVQSSLYPSMLNNTTSTQSSYNTSYAASGSSSKKLVKALYDFEAAEDNELTFRAGDLISILDDSDANWWRGEGSNGSGLFPSNFVTPDLSVEPEPEFGVRRSEEEEEREQVVTFNEDLDVKEVDQNQPVLEVNEELIDRTLAALQSTDPEQTEIDPPELKRDEDTCAQMEKLIDRELEELDRKHLEYTVLNEKILDSLKLYDTLMNEMPAYIPPQQPYMSMQQPGIPPQHMMAGYPQGSFPGPGYTAPNQIQAPAAPGPSGAPQMGYSPNPVPQQNPYNPMYQQPSATNYSMNTVVTKPTDQPHQGAYTTEYGATASSLPGQYGGQPNQQSTLTYNGNMHNMAPYTMNNSPQPATLSPSHFPTNQISSQPLM